MIERPHTLVAAGANLRAVYLPPAWEGELPDCEERRLRVSISELFSPIVEIAPPSSPFANLRPCPEDRLVLALDSSLLGRRTPLAEVREFCDPYLFGMANALRCGFRAAVLPSPEYLDALAPAIASHLRAHYSLVEEGLSASRLERVIAFIEERLADPISVEDLAATAHLSTFHFSRMFRRSLGASPHDYVTQRRLERAKQLLAGTNLRLAEVVERTGYRTQAHFTRAFHEATNLTPMSYRRAARGQSARSPEGRP